MVSFKHEQNSICSQTQLKDIAHEHTIICRKLFAGHLVGSRPMKRKKHLHGMIILLMLTVFRKTCSSVIHIDVIRSATKENIMAGFFTLLPLLGKIATLQTAEFLKRLTRALKFRLENSFGCRKLSP